MKHRVVEETDGDIVIYVPQKKFIFWWRDFTYMLNDFLVCRHAFNNYPDACKFIDSLHEKKLPIKKRVMVEIHK